MTIPKRRPKTHGKSAIVLERRTRVTRLLLHGHSMGKIGRIFEAEGYVNPETHQAWSASTIENDVKLLKKEWRERATADFDAMRAACLEKILYAQDIALKERNITAYLSAVKQEIDLFSLNGPIKIAQTDTQGNDLEPVRSRLRDRLITMAQRVETTNGHGATLPG